LKLILLGCTSLLVLGFTVWVFLTSRNFRRAKPRIARLGRVLGALLPVFNLGFGWLAYMDESWSGFFLPLSIPFF
jgi:hypothetical protein